MLTIVVHRLWQQMDRELTCYGGGIRAACCYHFAMHDTSIRYRSCQEEAGQASNIVLRAHAGRPGQSQPVPRPGSARGAPTAQNSALSLATVSGLRMS